MQSASFVWLSLSVTVGEHVLCPSGNNFCDTSAIADNVIFIDLFSIYQSEQRRKKKLTIPCAHKIQSSHSIGPSLTIHENATASLFFTGRNERAFESEKNCLFSRLLWLLLVDPTNIVATRKSNHDTRIAMEAA